MKRTVPLLITAIAGFVLIVSFFIPDLKGWGEDAAVWFDILAAIAFVLGGGNLLKLHLKTMSDKKPGWGYSAITIIAFLVTLIFGLFKIGSPPRSNVEFYGETFVSFPLEAMPEFRIAGTLPPREDDEPIPASVRTQLREENGELIFIGWMSRDQKSDLLKYRETLDWQCRVEKLFTASQPSLLQDRVRFYPAHTSLAFKGVLTEERQADLQKLLPESEIATQAIEELASRTRQATTIQSSGIPKSFKIPEEANAYFKEDQAKITIVGPLSPELQKEIVFSWSGFEPAMPLTATQEQELFAQIENAGRKLTDAQSETFKNFFAAEWHPDVMVAAINTAGIPPKKEKTACELLEEQQAGAKELVLELPTPEPTLLNPEQIRAVTLFVNEPGQTAEELKTELSSLGEITSAQLASIDEFINGLPRHADVLKALGLELLRTGPLTPEQREVLFQPAATQYAWKTDIGRLFVASHQIKYPWSGSYTAQGNPFWWIYEYVLQPLMTTTFAMLAFYVASAAFRAFRAKNLEATLLLGTAFIVLLGRTYLGVQLTAWVPDAFSALKIDQMTVYIMKIFNTAGNRAIMIGIALGIASTSLKVLLGIDRSYLGSGDD